MITADERPSIVSLTALREHIKRSITKTQDAGMADVAAVLSECFSVVSFLAKEQSWGVFRGTVQWVQDKNNGYVGTRIRNKFMGANGKLKVNRIEATFFGPTLELAKTLKIGDEIACDGKLQRAQWGTKLCAWHLEIVKRGEPSDGNGRP